MSWLRVDDLLPEHTKADMLERACACEPALLAAAWMAWLHLACDCARRNTDGRFDLTRAQRVLRLPPALVERALDVLCVVELLDRKTDGYAFHDWTDYQLSAADRAAKRDALSKIRAEAGRSGGLQSGKVRSKQNEAIASFASRSKIEANAKQNEAKPRSKTQANAKQTSLETPYSKANEANAKQALEAPSHPIPSHKEEDARVGALVPAPKAAPGVVSLDVVRSLRPAALTRKASQ